MNLSQDSVDTAPSPGGAASRKPEDSPFKRELKYGKNASAKKKAKTSKQAVLKILHIKPNVNDDHPENGVHGFIICCNGYTERLFTQPLYNRNDADNETFLETVNPIGRVFTLTNRDGTPMQNSNGYQMRGIGIEIPTDAVLETTEQVIRDFINNTFIPALVQLPSMIPGREPVLGDGIEGYEQFSVWSEVTTDQDIRTFIAIELLTGGLRNAQEWMRASRENLYSMYPLGALTNQVRVMYGLAGHHMANVDATRLGLVIQLHNGVDNQNNDNDNNNDDDDDA